MKYIVTWQEFDSRTIHSSDILDLDELIKILKSFKTVHGSLIVDTETIRVHNIEVKQ